jgi:hypothetical protein
MPQRSPLRSYFSPVGFCVFGCIHYVIMHGCQHIKTLVVCYYLFVSKKRSSWNRIYDKLYHILLLTPFLLSVSKHTQTPTHSHPHPRTRTNMYNHAHCKSYEQCGICSLIQQHEGVAYENKSFNVFLMYIFPSIGESLCSDYHKMLEHKTHLIIKVYLIFVQKNK